MRLLGVFVAHKGVLYEAGPDPVLYLLGGDHLEREERGVKELLGLL